MRKYRAELGAASANAQVASALGKLLLIVVVGLVLVGTVLWWNGRGSERAADRLTLPVDLPGLAEVEYTVEAVAGGYVLTDVDGDPWKCEVAPISIDDMEHCEYWR